MLTGRSYRAEQALAAGLVDRLVAPADLKNAAKAFACRHRTSPPAASVDGLLISAATRVLAPRAREEGRQPVRGVITIRRLTPSVELWQRFGANGAQAFEAEARSIGRLMVTPTARSLVRVFFLQDRMKALGGKSPQEIGNVHVVGAGVMGGDIAGVVARCGELNVTLQDRP